MLMSRWHGGHVVEYLPFDVLLRSRRIAAGLPGAIRAKRSSNDWSASLLSVQ
jgi:hypothetical protein